ncbi:MAG: hypothetical protein JO141_27365 [Bradyrhizobium sp.]|nr:hypothetical protein [Bradyrhizobium sp.]
MYLLVIFWFPSLMVAGLIWALASVHEKPSDLWPAFAVLGLILLVTKKIVAIVYYPVVVQGDRIIKALRHYR